MKKFIRRIINVPNVKAECKNIIAELKKLDKCVTNLDKMGIDVKVYIKSNDNFLNDVI